MKRKKILYLACLFLTACMAGFASCKDEKSDESDSVLSSFASEAYISETESFDGLSSEEMNSFNLESEENSFLSEESDIENESLSVSVETELDSEESTLESASEHVHRYSETLIRESDCVTQGEIYCKCMGCDDGYTKYIPVIDHTPETVKGYAATCQAKGLSDGEKCAECQTELKAQEFLPTLEHDFAADSPACHLCGLYNGVFLEYRKNLDGKGYTCIGFQWKAQLARRLAIPDMFNGLPVTAIDIDLDEAEPFYRHQELVSIEIGKNVTKISEIAFSECYNLVEVYDRSTACVSEDTDSCLTSNALRVAKGEIENFESWVFDRNGYLIFDEYGDKLGEQVFVGYCGSEKKLVLPEGITKINRYAFKMSNTITSITLPSTLEYIAMCGFSNITVLGSVYFTNTDGWYVSYSSNGPWTEVIHDLKNPTTALECLTEVYLNYIWKRES